MTSLSLAVEVAGLRLENPLILASGILGTSPRLLARAAREGAAAVVTKSFTLEPRRGHLPPIVVEVKAGLVNAVGLENPGAQAIHDLVSEYRRLSHKPIIVSVAGSSPDEFARVARTAEEAGADAVELNLSCPHARELGLELGRDPMLVAKVTEAVRRAVSIPILVKLGICDNLIDCARRAEERGADAIVLINTLRAVVIDVWLRRPVLTNVVGGLSGPAIHPIAVYAVWTVYRRVRVPIIGCGGVEDWRDAVELMLAGASAVQVGSAIARRGLTVFREIADGIRSYLRREGFSSVREIVGLAHKALNA